MLSKSAEDYARVIRARLAKWRRDHVLHIRELGTHKSICGLPVRDEQIAKHVSLATCQGCIEELEVREEMEI